MANGRTASQQKTSGTPKHRSSRREIHLVAENGSGRFEHTFTKPGDLVDLVTGWLESPDRPYSIRIAESEQTDGQIDSEGKAE
jgi:hypothetical protein